MDYIQKKTDKNYRLFFVVTLISLIFAKKSDGFKRC